MDEEIQINGEVERAIQQLAEIDEIILKDSKYRSKGEYDRFMSLVNQKGGLIDFIRARTSKTPYWTQDGYRLR